MRFVILSTKPLPMFNGIYGPILSPAEYDVHLVLNMIALGIDVREVMDDGSYRKLKSDDKKLMELLEDKNKKMRAELKEHRNRERVVKNEPQGNVKIKEERPAPKKEKQVPKKEFKPEHKKQKPKEEPKEEVVLQEPKKEFIIDELEKPE